MGILASGISSETAVVIVLCILTVVFMLVNAILVVSLHRQNKKLLKLTSKSLPSAEESCRNQENGENDEN